MALKAEAARTIATRPEIENFIVAVMKKTLGYYLIC
jgi:hypothetical protein